MRNSIQFNRLALIAALAVSTLVAACSEIFGPAGKVVVLEIAPQKKTCITAFPGQCLVGRERPDTNWRFVLEDIQGFEFEPGHHYTLRVSKYRYGEYIADASSHYYRLLNILAKQPE